MEIYTFMMAETTFVWVDEIDLFKMNEADREKVAQILREPAMLDQTSGLTESSFSVPLLGRVFAQLQKRHNSGLDVSLAVMEELDPEEMSHLTGISQRLQGPVNQTAFADCVRTVLAEHQSAGVSSDADLMALRDKLKERKGTKI